MRYTDLPDADLAKLIDNRWDSSAEIWEEIKKVTKKNTKVYDGKPEWITRLPAVKPHISSNRVFTNTESVINSLIANPPKPNVIPSRDTDTAKELARGLEKVLVVKYDTENVKEVIRQALRDLYFSRLLVLKPYWDAKKNDIAIKRVDPLKVRFGKDSQNEEQSEFAIEEVETTVAKLVELFPDKKKEILRAANVEDENRLLIENPSCVYRECWIGDSLIIKFKGLILSKGKNPYWDWDGLLATKEELYALGADDEPVSQKTRRMKEAKAVDFGMEVEDEMMTVQEYRKQLTEEEAGSFEAYLFNYFDHPRKPYIYATILNNDNRPIGRTSFIEQASPLQEGVDRRKQAIDYNAEIVNGITKVDSGVMDKGDAQALRYDAGGVIYGKGVIQGVQREFGQGLPAFIFEDMQDSRNEIDNIMAASSAFRGERQGQETKAGRLALIEQSFLRLNEMVQVIDYVNQELFAWWFQLMKTRYTERHMIKDLGPDNSVDTFEVMQDDFEDGIEVRVIPGKSLPQDREFLFERAQNDVEKGYISPLDYLEEAGYNNPKEKAKNAYLYAQNPAKVLGIEEEMQQMAPEGMPPEMPPQMPTEMPMVPQM